MSEPGNDLPGQPPPEIQAAAAQVRNWLDQQANRRLSAEELERLSPAERLDRARRFDQSRMPSWRDPRKTANR